MDGTLIILYVADQSKSAAFYRTVLGCAPSLDVPGMTEIPLPGGATLGLMPVAGIRRLLENLPDPGPAAGIPRCELYLPVANPAEYHRRALANGAIELDPLEERNWGDTVAYSMDSDGHVLAFATKTAD